MPQHLVGGREDPGVPRESTVKAMRVKGRGAGCQGAHRSSLPFLWIFRIRPSLCFAVARPFLGRFPVGQPRGKHTPWQGLRQQLQYRRSSDPSPPEPLPRVPILTPNSRPILGKKCSSVLPAHPTCLRSSSRDLLPQAPCLVWLLFSTVFSPVFLPLFFGERTVIPSPLTLPTSTDKYLVSDYSSRSLMMLPPEPCFIQNPHLHQPMPHLLSYVL